MEMPIDMQHQAMGYDRTATMFSPEGHLLQVEYAEKAVRLGSSSLGMVCTDGIFILADKRISDPLIVPESAKKIYEIDSHIITSVAGIISDARVLIEKAQILAQQNTLTYDSLIEPEVVAKEISNIKQQFTHYGGARPFGAALMFAGLKGKRPQLFTSDITGNYFSYFANAIGENDEKIREKLRESYKKNLNLKEGIKLALKIYQEIQGEKFEIEKFEMALMNIDTPKIVRATGQDIKKL
jgi:proteasome alpha subunit